MKTGSGKGVCEGIVEGKIFFFKKEVRALRKYKISDTGLELNRFYEARDAAINQLRKLYDKVSEGAGENEAMIMEIHQMMLQDEDFNETIEQKIKSESLNAEYAVKETGEEFSNVFSSIEDEYMKARAEDIKDITERVISILSGAKVNCNLEEPRIIVAEDLSPSDTVQFEKSKILAFVTRKGSLNSHTAILARTMNIPSIVQANIELEDSLNERFMLVDGINGQFYIEPDEDTLRKYEEIKNTFSSEVKELNRVKGLDDITIDGKKIKVYANVGNLQDIDKVIESDAQGIGLFRSEFLYLGKETYPTEEEQFQVYKEAALKLQGKKLIIRTLDIGADKQVDYFKLDKEENPAMGLRAIRICLMRPHIFKTQLRAIYRASVYGNISIMFPMITSLEEITVIKEIVSEVREKLKQDKLPYKEVELGIMIETPAAVMISDELAKEVDFFSVGTNDLTQYTLAMDRQNEKLDYFFNSHHKAVLRMLDMVVKNAHDNGIWAGICGELGADLELTRTFLEMGFDELSVSPGKVLKLRKRIREIKLS
ncbi:MAG: phosphoenolpyruvate--protein phosphotransferase [Clostridium sp.]|nr:phosphoenolpyruvate--protein phosphotransferase [Clostridium sp.]MDU7083066.1 phosphoenolpyruvate--protein phosphotransferase [Clostridium sp.]